MLRALLADRFTLVVHRDTRALPVYNLLRASPDPKLDKLRISDGACGVLRAPGAPAPSPEQLRPFSNRGEHARPGAYNATA